MTDCLIFWWVFKDSENSAHMCLLVALLYTLFHSAAQSESSFRSKLYI